MSDDVEVVEVVDAEIVEAVNVAGAATVQVLGGGWHLVTFGCWSVSISDDGQIRLPQSTSHDSVGDLCAALSAAAEVAAKVVAANEAREASRSEAARRGVRSLGGIVVSDSGVPAGAVRMPFASVSPRNSRSGSGR